VTNFRAVLFNCRGTLALTLSGPQWFVLSFETGAQTPQPEMFQLGPEGLNLPASRVLMVGDRAA
jgi:hypothetical protein